MTSPTMRRSQRLARESQARAKLIPGAKPCVASHDWVSAEAEKILLRLARIEKTRWQSKALPFDEELDQARHFWRAYQEINVRRLPDDPAYSGIRAGVAFSTTLSFWTITSPAAGQIRIIECYIGGEATASAVNRLSYQRCTSGTTPTNQTPELAHDLSPAAASTFATTWSSQPSLSGNPLYQVGVNAFGGMDRWVPQPGEEVYVTTGAKFTARSASGTSTFSGTVLWEEM